MTVKNTTEQIYPHDLEQASNGYLMSLVAIIAGLPLPIVNVLASLIFYISHAKSSYFVRWHGLQALLAQCLVIPFNSLAFAWTLTLLFSHTPLKLFSLQGESTLVNDSLFGVSLIYYGLYVMFVFILNIAEFVATIYTASQVRKGVNVRWFLIANITDSLCGKQKTDPYRI